MLYASFSRLSRSKMGAKLLAGDADHFGDGHTKHGALPPLRVYEDENPGDQ